MKKITLLLVVLSFFLNGLVPKYSLCAREYDALFCLIENQPLLQCCFSLSVIPLAIVNKLILEQSAPRSSAQKHSNGAAENRAAAASEFSLALYGSRDVLKNSAIRFALPGNGPGAPGDGAGLQCRITDSAAYPRGKSIPAPWCRGIFLLLLVSLLVRRPRGALCDDYPVMRRAYSVNPIRSDSGSGFSLGRDT